MYKSDGKAGLSGHTIGHWSKSSMILVFLVPVYQPITHGLEGPLIPDLYNSLKNF